MSEVEPNQRLEMVVQAMKEASRGDDPASLVKAFAARMRELVAWDGLISVSRRGVVPPAYRIARSSLWKEEIDPWRERGRLPVVAGGLIGRVLEAGRPTLIDDLVVEADDPAYELLSPFKSLVAIPVFDQGEALNFVFWLREVQHGFDPRELPEWVWMANLFGRATNNLVLKNELAQAYAQLDREFAAIAQIQTSLLPAQVPAFSNLELAVHYRSSRRAGGDYYEFFPLEDGRVSILVADVCGHGTPAAVYMAITQCLARSFPELRAEPRLFLAAINRRFAREYAGDTGNFVGAVAAIYEPESRRLRWSSAGMPPPRRFRSGVEPVRLEAAQSMPLGILESAHFEEAVETLATGDLVILHSDGLTEARSPAGVMFGEARLDTVFQESATSAAVGVESIMQALTAFQGHATPVDDLTLVALRVC